MTRPLRPPQPARTGPRLGIAALLGVLALATLGADFHVLFEEPGTLHDARGEAVHADSVHAGCDASGVHVERARPAPHRHCPGCLLSQASRVDFGPRLVLHEGHGAGRAIADSTPPGWSRLRLSGPGSRAPPLA